MAESFNSKITAELFTPGSYYFNKKVDKMQSDWGSHFIYLVSSPLEILDKLIQMATYPILRTIDPLWTPIVHLQNKSHKEAIFHFLIIPIKWTTAIPAIFFYEIKKICAIGLEFSLIPTCAKTILGKNYSDFYFAEREFRQNHPLLEAQDKTVYTFKPYTARNMVGDESLKNLKTFCICVFWIRNSYSIAQAFVAGIIKDCCYSRFFPRNESFQK